MIELLPRNYDTIFRYVDDYSLYCYYIGEELVIGQSYSSPLRKRDINPSFSLFFSSYDLGRIYFKDQGTGESGNVFKFIALLHKISYLQAFNKVDTDFLLGIWNDDIENIKHKLITKNVPKIKEKVEIGITSRQWNSSDDYFWWDKYKIDHKTLAKYNVTAVDVLHYKHKNKTHTVYPKQLTFAYRIGKYYKIYQPYSKEHKFINNYPSHYIEGFEQLPYKQDTLIITKSLKDVMQLCVLGYESVAPRSENIVMPDKYFDYFRSNYKNIYVLFDNDGKHQAHKYPFPSIEIPVALGKDISDYVSEHGVFAGEVLIRQILRGDFR